MAVLEVLMPIYERFIERSSTTLSAEAIYLGTLKGVYDFELYSTTEFKDWIKVSILYLLNLEAFLLMWQCRVTLFTSLRKETLSHSEMRIGSTTLTDHGR